MQEQDPDANGSKAHQHEGEFPERDNNTILLVPNPSLAPQAPVDGQGLPEPDLRFPTERPSATAGCANPEFME